MIKKEVEDVKGFLIGKRFKTALDVLDIIKIYFGSYKWHNNPDGTLTVKVNGVTFNIRFNYSILEKNTQPTQFWKKLYKTPKA